jgi:hypothetical protein|tara:strand:+ start:369 stop:509 length:141 start_codon:yes stop_codon:yes gene_type:complete
MILVRLASVTASQSRVAVDGVLGWPWWSALMDVAILLAREAAFPHA